VKPTVPELAENQMAHEMRKWEYRVGELMKTEQVVEGNLCNLFAVLMLLCNSEVKSQVESSTIFSKLEIDLYSMWLLRTIKKLMYIGGTNDLNVWHNKALTRQASRHTRV